MRRVFIVSGMVTAGLALYGVAGVAGLATGLSIRAVQSAAPATPAAHAVIERRFPSTASLESERTQPAGNGDILQAQALKLAFARSGRLSFEDLRADDLQTAKFQSIALRYGLLTVGLLSRPTPTPLHDAPWQERFFLASILPAGEAASFTSTASSPAATSLASAASKLEADQPHAATTHVPPKIQSANAEPPVRHRPPSRLVLSDAQIAGIKTRLNLTPDQEALWPAVEAALREVSYAKTAQAQARAALDGGRLAYIDPNGADVQQLKMAALPLIMRLNDDQRREVKSLAHVMGLDGVAGSF
jgi:hypothetical protein